MSFQSIVDLLRRYGAELEFLATRRDGIGTLCSSVVAMMKTTRGGGSSTVLSNALNDEVESMWTSSMMNIL